MFTFECMSTNNLYSFIILFNLLPVVVLFVVIPVNLLRRYRSLLMISISFVSAGLMADVFLRLFTPIILSLDHRIGLLILTSILTSFLIEKFIRNIQIKNEQFISINNLTYLFLLINVIQTFLNMLTSKIIYQIVHIFYGYIILIYSGWSSFKVMRYLLLTGLVGSSFYLLLLQIQSNPTIEFVTKTICLPIITGFYVYISTVHLIPEMLEGNSGKKGTILKIISICLSILSVFYLQKYT